jgi:MscS family membrane protein
MWSGVQMNPAGEGVAKRAGQWVAGGLLGLLLFCWASLSVAVTLPGAPPAATSSVAAKAVQPAETPPSLASPRATMATFLHAMEDVKRGRPERIQQALSTLDLSTINPLIRDERGSELAWQLLEVMNRTRRVDLAQIPLMVDAGSWEFAHYDSGSVRIGRLGDGRWLFDRQTLAALPDITTELAGRARVTGQDGTEHLPWHLRLREQLPAPLKRQGFLLEYWQWLGLLLTVVVGVLMDWLVSLLLRLAVRGWRQRTTHEAFAGVEDSILRPFGMMAMAMAWWSGINLLGLPDSALLLLLVAVKFLASAAGVWAAYRLVDLVSAWISDRARRSQNKIDDVLAPLIPRTLKIFVTVIGVVFIADNLNIDVTGLLAGLGLGGLAFALAAKDMVQNLFGSVTVLLDQTFTVGDWIIVGEDEGNVERIGFRSTRIRTFYNSMLTIPNSRFITADVDNMGERRYRRMKAVYGVTYDTPADKIEAFCEGIRELVRQHPYMRKDYYHVYFNEFGPSSLNILVYVFWETPDWATELRERHRFLLDCLRLARQLGVSFAFPTQTLHLHQGDAPNPSAQEVAQQEAFSQGQARAQDIVSATTGLGQRPPPVRIE